MKLSTFRSLIRELVLEMTSLGTDPREPKGFYSTDEERGVDIHSPWYRSPGELGSSDPGRPDDAAGYIGMKAPEGEEGLGGDSSEDTPIKD
jgi:hypothetical protein